MSKRKVLFVVHQLNHGGVQGALLSALNAIDYGKNEVTLYIRKNRCDFLGDVNSAVKQVIINQDTHHYYRRPKSVALLLCITLCRLIRQKDLAKVLTQRLNDYIIRCQMTYESKTYFTDSEEYDVAISYIQGYTAQFVAQYVKAKRKIMFYHGSTDETHDLHLRIMSCFSQIVAVNKKVQEVLGSLYPEFADKMTSIENYVDAELVRIKSAEQIVDCDKGKLILCSCGRFTPVKGFDIAIEAASRLKAKGLEFIWYFVGDGPERAKLENLISERNLTDNIIITGMQDNPYPWMDACDIYVQPSREEAHPLAIIEALILCKPVISTSTIGGQNLVKDGVSGLLVDINAESLSNGIVRLANDTLARNNMELYLKSIDHSKDFERYQNDWKRLLEGESLI